MFWREALGGLHSLFITFPPHTSFFESRVTLDSAVKDRRLRGFEPQVLRLLLRGKKSKYLQREEEERGFVGLSLPVPAASQGTIKVGARASPMGSAKVFESVFDKAKGGGGGWR